MRRILLISFADRKPSWIASLAFVAVVLFALVTPAHADLVLTAAGVNGGFTLTTFVSGYNAQYGPLAQGIAPNGNVITGSMFNHQIFVFNDVDARTWALL